VLLTLEVVGAHADRLGNNRRRLFTDEGGTIGRVEGNAWVLPDQYVSSSHAAIQYADGVFYVVDTNSANGVFLNSMDLRLEPGQSYPLRSGDRLFIEPFEIHVAIIAAEPRRPAPPPLAEPPRTTQMPPGKSARSPALGDPFAVEAEVPFVGTLPTPASVRSPPTPVRRDELIPGSSAADRTPVDPMAALGLPDKAKPARRPNAADLAGGSVLQSHFVPPAVSTPQPAAPPIAVPPSAPSPSPLIPEDYNPLAQTGFERPPRPAPPPKPAVPPPKPAPSPPVQQRPPASAAPPTPVAPRAPAPRTPAPEKAAPAQPPAPAATPPRQPQRPVRPAARAPVRRPAEEARPAPSPPPAAPVPRWPIEDPPRSAPKVDTPRAAPPKVPPQSLDFETMLAAAGIEGLPVTPELAANFGNILRAVVDGLMDVLRARDEVREAFRLRVTGFQPRENNPLKFSANAEDALHNLLVKRNSAYLGPVESFEEAFEDLRAHQMAMLAGLRAAYESMVAEFDPERLESRFERFAKSGGLLSGSTRQRYWDLYRETYRDTVSDADTSFRKLFGEAFGRAYDEQVQRLKAKRRGERT
jgi:type VI secretion system protein ImpI